MLVPMTFRRRRRRSFRRIADFFHSNMRGALNAVALRQRRGHVRRRGPWAGPAERQLRPGGSQKEAIASTMQGYSTANIIVEPENPGNPRSLFRVYAFGRVYEEGLTAAQAHVLVGDFLEALILPGQRAGAPLRL
jgi:hypothetical protein